MSQLAVVVALTACVPPAVTDASVKFHPPPST
jgi:hypothetical protein